MRCNGLNEQINELTRKYDSKKAQLEQNDTYQQLGQLEQKIRNLESATFEAKDCEPFANLVIDSKTAESDYKPLAKQVMRITSEINKQIVKIMQMSPTR
jgi:intraflagellar transport protein 74